MIDVETKPSVPRVISKIGILKSTTKTTDYQVVGIVGENGELLEKDQALVAYRQYRWRTCSGVPLTYLSDVFSSHARCTQFDMCGHKYKYNISAQTTIAEALEYEYRWKRDSPTSHIWRQDGCELHWPAEHMLRCHKHLFEFATGEQFLYKVDGVLCWEPEFWTKLDLALRHVPQTSDTNSVM